MSFINRLSFFSIILGALGLAKAQTTSFSPIPNIPTDAITKKTHPVGCLELWPDGYWHDCAPTIPKPANNECPVCHTIAPAFYDLGSDPNERWELTRCLHCNAAFYQLYPKSSDQINPAK